MSKPLRSGLVRMETPGQTQKRVEDQQGLATEESQVDLGSVRHSLITGVVNRTWQRNKTARLWIDRRLLACLRARKGVYGPDELALITSTGANSTVYMKLSETKCRAAAAWMKEILMPAGDRPWGLDPSHMPDMPAPLKKMIEMEAGRRAREAMQQEHADTGNVLGFSDFEQTFYEQSIAVEDEVRQKLQQKATEAARRMEMNIGQMMDEGGWDGTLSEFIEDLTTFPTAFVKGPFDSRAKTLEWGPAWSPVVKDKPIKKWTRVSPFDIYPAPLAHNLQQRDFIERMRLEPAEIYDCIGMPDYDEEAIRWVLDHHEKGHLRHWIWTDPERIRLESDTFYDWLANEDIIDALHFWGRIEGRVLRSWGVDVKDDNKRYECDAIMVGSRIIKVSINRDPLGRRPYRHACYEEIPGAIWGRAIPELCEAEQDMCNAAARALVNNMGIASGPMVGINVDRLPPGEAITTLVPWKMFQLNSDPNGGRATDPPLIFFQPELIADQLMAVFTKFEERADDATGIPKYTYGNEKVGGAGATFSGLSMLMGAAAKGIRRGIMNVDKGVIEETVRDCYIDRMIHGNDMGAKGDCKIVTRGAAALLIKEQMQGARLQALELSGQNPMDQQIVGLKARAALWREVFRSMHLPVEDLPSDKDIEAMIEQQQNTPPPPTPAEVNANASLQVEHMKSQSRERVAGAQIASKVIIAKHKGAGAGTRVGAGKSSLPIFNGAQALAGPPTPAEDSLTESTPPPRQPEQGP